ncbi:trehalase-like domain-containing protein [Streptomyces sp. CRN 30]|uniref:trehalase-like domain-containing protein n=1 Tax=Streptomyces sp. CRN 30 TaxID=3075613 RepID=UPI0039C3DF32
MDRYPPIAEHGMTGDLQTAALVSSQGTVDWWCTPRFDAPSVFASLLDTERGGHCALRAEVPDGDAATVRQLYLSDTAVLVTRFMTPGGVGEVADFMPPLTSSTATDRHRLIRVVRVVRGSMPFAFAFACRPRFDYGRAPHTLTRPDGRSAVFHGVPRTGYRPARPDHR